MIYSKLHGLYHRLLNKLTRTVKEKNWNDIPINHSTTFFKDGSQLFDPHLVGTETLGNQMKTSQTCREVLEVLKKLSPNNDVDFAKEFYEKGLETFGENWVYADINTALLTISKNIKVENYMEIGVRRGRSMTMMASHSPEANFYGFDMWIEDYCDSPNPGPEFVKEELSKVGYQGKIEL